MFYLETAWSAAFACAFFRSLGFVALLPFGGEISGALRRVGFAFGLSLVLMLSAPVLGKFEPVAFAADFLVGLLVALPWALVVEAAGMWGELFDLTRGQNLAFMYDPSSESRTPTVLCLRLYIWVVLLLGGALESILLSLQRSFEILPMAGMLIERLVQSGRAVLALLEAGCEGMLSGFMPIALVFFTCDCIFGALGRILPQAHLLGESFQVKSYLGLSMLAILACREELELLAGLCAGWARLPWL